MNVFLNIEIVENVNFDYEKPWLSWAKNSISNIVTFDIDNHSDATLLNYAAGLIEKEEKIIIYIDVKGEAGSGKFLGLAETIIKQKEKCLVIMKGESKILQKMFSLLKENFRQNLSEEKMKRVIQGFFQ
jgi:hypothetical protein